MRGLYLCLVALALALSASDVVGIPYSAEICQGDAYNYVLGCVSQLFDANDDDVITAAEIDAGVLALNGTDTAQFYTGVNSTGVLMYCDLDLDGQLTMNDWNNSTREETSMCLQHPLYYNIMCWVCADNGYNHTIVSE